MTAFWTIHQLVVDSSTAVVESTQQGEKRNYFQVYEKQKWYHLKLGKKQAFQQREDSWTKRHMDASLRLWAGGV